jgi:hypothetical protein
MSQSYLLDPKWYHLESSPIEESSKIKIVNQYYRSQYLNWRHLRLIGSVGGPESQLEEDSPLDFYLLY